MHPFTEAAVAQRQSELRAAAERDRCCGRGDLVRARRRRLLAALVRR